MTVIYYAVLLLLLLLYYCSMGWRKSVKSQHSQKWFCMKW